MQHVQEGKRTVRYLSRYPKNTGVWQLINIKGPKKMKKDCNTKHMVVELISGKDSKRTLKKSGEREMVED